MKTIKIKDLMVPLEEYATVSVEATLFDAVIALEEAQEELDRSRYHYLHRAVLVYDEQDNVVGKVSQLCVLQALEPRYKEMGEPSSLSKAGFSNGFLRDMLRQYSLWDKPLADICRKGAHIKVKDFMHRPSEGEFVDEESTLEEAIHLLVMGRHNSLLVTRSGNILGILRQTDVFHEVFQRMKTCNL